MNWRAWLVLLLLSSCCGANTLTLEFAQEGEPKIPRAMVLIHNTFENRTSFTEFFQSWAALNWARSQYCSVYVYEYTGNNLNNLVLPSALAKDLYTKIRSNGFKSGRSDDVNPYRTTSPADGRQPKPSFRSDELELLFAGHGYGGLVARETALLAKKDGIKVTRVAYVGTPLDGLSTIDLILAFTIKERAYKIGLPRVLTLADFLQLSPAWWHLVELFDSNADWKSYFAPTLQDVKMVAAYGACTLESHPTDNVLYGRNRRIIRDNKAQDGLVPQPSAWGKFTGPQPWLKETHLEETSHSQLSEKSARFLIEELVDEELTFGYLARRQGIEEYIRGKGDLPPIGTYYDERDVNMQPQWRNAYASKKGLYEMMWGVAP